MKGEQRVGSEVGEGRNKGVEMMKKEVGSRECTEMECLCTQTG